MATRVIYGAILLPVLAIALYFSYVYLEWYMFADYCENTAPKSMSVYRRNLCRRIHEPKIDQIRLLIYDSAISALGYVHISTKVENIMTIVTVLSGYFCLSRSPHIRKMSAETTEYVQRILKDKRKLSSTGGIVRPPDF